MGETEKRGEEAKVFKKGGKQGQGVGALKRGDWNLFMKYVQVLLKKPPKKTKKSFSHHYSNGLRFLYSL